MTMRMNINGEPCELVEDFGQLRVADTIYMLSCNWCGKSPHRAMLVRPVIGPVMMPDRTVGIMPGYPMLPEPHQVQPGQRTMVTPPSVGGRSIWRVIDPQKATGDDVKQGEQDALQRPERVVVAETTGPAIPLEEKK